MSFGIFTRGYAEEGKDLQDALILIKTPFDGCIIPGMSTAEERLRNPPPGSRVAAARDFGVDLTLLIERLRKTPEGRVRDLQSAINGLEKMRGRARRKTAAGRGAGKAQETA